MNRSLEKIHMKQDKNNAFVSVGDVVRIKSKNGDVFEGEITCIDIKKEGDRLHPIMDIKSFVALEHPWDSFWVENIAELEIIRFKGED